MSLLTRQYEVARVDEARQGSQAQIVDPAAVPDRPSLYRVWVLLGALLAALPLALLIAQAAELAGILRGFRRRSGSWAAALEEAWAGERDEGSEGFEGARHGWRRRLHVSCAGRGHRGQHGHGLADRPLSVPIEQGYYYTLLSLAALQTIFELGFSFVILQLAAHESALLTIHPDGRIEGDRIALARLASVLRLTIRWYLRAAIALAFVLLPLGIVFFSEKTAQVSWFGPWVAAALAVSATFLFTPLFSFLEGCNQVRQVARLRMFQALIVLAMSWAAIASGHGLYACALVNLGWIAAGAVFLARRHGLLLSLLRFSSGEDEISWRNEIWPFQWKIAVSWLCSYFTMQVFTPILFLFRGPEEAGRMGLTLSVVGYLPIVALCWMTPKAAPFGQLVKCRPAAGA